ncbi:MULTISPECIES: 3-oxoadipyl-CoA thiolase [Sulfitobacter]|jgi:acetyl-CoA acyltransferase|uniref:3-oxoadipyl-CoA thiolase n=1 Tax=Sulfitobacter TaxID=60136 RepID=UPI0007D98AEF|nr:3-oxoadipyl-CoA thiolase [Sulfitobacter pontiacus]HBU53390.1 3-oxoadipyl-CoA thiolase [Sulfitobacter sp.]OAN74281.1 3-oxoadipyl-CoA thiolase [Sulfitobacter pontiacus]QLL41263.1 3-oxoadipyl-CoA thiolase [Sulfitobacter pontiacus]BDY14292.1 acetyl-CoA acetyltransferase [Sulfitobacter pontiacus]HCI99781.1 3-oxoadipyl-CoA thiolase [Sulfitobacter sp.]|tara:strand:- start:447 stop:1649 length:1203 start_codon:yes stop_codon:yes gene_type:complete
MDAFICDAQRTPIGRFGGALSSVRADDLAAAPIAALMARNPDLDWSKIDDVIFGCANQAGEDNRNVARMAALLAGLPVDVPGATINRLCASGMDAVGVAARAIKAGDMDLAIAGGVESMTRAPFVMPKAETAFSRNNAVYDTTIGWRFVNPKMKAQYGVESMPETGDNVATDYDISREDQDAFAKRSQDRWEAADKAGVFADEITPVSIPQRKGDPIVFDRDEHPRPGTTIDALTKLRPINGPDLTVTAGNASGVNDGAAAMLMASEAAASQHGLTPIARVVGISAAGVEPRVMGIGPVPASQKVLARAGLTIDQMDVIELNEAFASQGIATLRALGVADDAPHVNANGGAIAIGHPLGMSGARLVMTAALQLKRTGGRYALCTMCVGVGQGVAIILERA